jgi:hypothetical protein
MMKNTNPYRRPLKFEQLEDRRVLAPIIVTNTNALGGSEPVGSLGWAIGQANANPDWSEINFDTSLAGLSIQVDTGSLGGGEYIQEPTLIKGLDRHLYAPIRLIASVSDPEVGLTFTGFGLTNTASGNRVGVMNLDLTNFEVGVRLRDIDTASSGTTAPFVIRNVRISNAIDGIVFDNMDAPFEIEESLIDGRGAVGAGIKIPNNSRSTLPSLIGNIDGVRSQQSLLAAGTGNAITDFAIGIELTGQQGTGGFSALRISGNLLGARVTEILTAAPNTIGISASSGLR